GSTVAWLFWVVGRTHYSVQPELLITPMATLFTLTGLVWLIMVVVRNLAVIRGSASIRYFSDFKSDTPVDDRLERPARTFNNLMQVPTLFYIICILMLIEKETDNVQVILAWTYVLLRWLHAIIYMALNWVPYRFAFWASSCITLGIIWFRFVEHGTFS
ncbi:MAG: MAPEG family protein, partial [Methyloglobulus sp.]|nr:MAPEG family protein [Methyloglobulus sp.]